MKKQVQEPIARCIGEGYDHRTGVRSWVFKVIDKTGKVTKLVFPFGGAGSTEGGVLEAVGRAGYPVPLRSGDRREFAKLLLGGEPKSQLEVVSASGWSDSGNFVTPQRVYGGGARRVVSTMGPSSDGQRFRRAGTLAQWKLEVAKPLHGNHLATFALAVAFASPLQQLVGVESGGFDLVGGSSIGKSTILTVAGSVWGGGGPAGFCNIWLSTSNALDDTACTHSDCFLALDETGLGGETQRDAARAVLHAAHRLPAGEEKARMGDQGQRRTWRLQFLGSTENSLQQLGSIAGESVAVGQHVRIVDIAADAGRGLGVWNRLPKGVTSAADFSDTIRNAAMQLYGAPAHRYLTRLVAELNKAKPRLIAWLEKRMQAFLNAIGATEWQGAQARVARRFALVYAAGALACKYDILPWQRKAVLSAVKVSHRRVMWPEALADLATPEQSIAMVRSYIERCEDDFIDLRNAASALSKRKIEAAPGIILSGKNRRTEYVFARPVWRDQVCAGADSERVWDNLSAADLVNRQGGGKRSVTRAFRKPVGRLRVISVKPTILDDTGEDEPDEN